MRLPRKFERVAVLVRKEFQQAFRDPRILRVVFAAPVIQLLVFGYAVSTDIRDTPTVLVDHDRSQVSRELADVLVSSGYFAIVERADRGADIVDALDHGRAQVGVEIPAGFARDLASGSGAQVQILLDGTNSNTALVARGYAERIIQSWSAGAAGTATPARQARIELRERAWFNPELASRNYNVPAVLGAIILLICQLLTALAVVREREIGTLEQLMVSPLQPAELIAGKTIPFALLGLVDLGLVTAVARLWFRVPFEGGAALFLLGSFFYILCCLGLGLLVSTISSTQREAFLATFLFFLPTVLLSGFMFPVSSMPHVFRWMTLGNPMRHYLVIVRGLFLKDTGFGDLWPSLTFLVVLGLGALGLAGSRFRRMGG